jgi:hypothetical protein
MREQLVSFEVAKLAKEKMFRLERNYFGYIDKFYHPITKSIRTYGMTGRINKDILIYIPTQSLLQKWLRETHKIHIETLPQKSSKDTVVWSSTCYNLKKYDCTYCTFHQISMPDYAETYEDALEKGLEKALNLIK